MPKNEDAAADAEIPDDEPLSYNEIFQMEQERVRSQAEMVHRSAMAKMTPMEMIAAGLAVATEEPDDMARARWQHKLPADFLGHGRAVGKTGPEILRERALMTDAQKEAEYEAAAQVGRTTPIPPELTFADDEEVAEAEIVGTSGFHQGADDIVDAEIVE